MKKHKIIWVLIPFIFLAVGCNSQIGSKILAINGHTLQVEIADTPQKRIQGLSGRTSLDGHSGMYFDFKTLSLPSMWMKGMNFPLDFIWIRDGVVEEIIPNVYPEPGATDEELTRYTPEEEVDAVLEVNAGWATENSVRKGQTVNLDQVR